MKSKRKRKMKNCIKKIKKCMKKSKKGMRLKYRIQSNKYNIYKIQFHKRIQKMKTLNKLLIKYKKNRNIKNNWISIKVY